MKKHYNNDNNSEDLRYRIIGMGENSLRKSYFPTLQKNVSILNRYRTLLDQTVDGIFLVNSKNFEFEDYNKAAEDLINALGVKTLIDFIIDKQIQDDLFNWILEGSGKDYFTGTSIVTINSDTKYLSYSFTKGNFEQSKFIIAIFRDVTEQKDLEEELFQSRKMDAIGQLAGGVAHDFNNMLSGIFGAAEIIQDESTNSEKVLKMADLIIKMAERAADLTTKLLSFSRKGKLRSTAIDIHELLEDTIEILKRSIDKKIEICNELRAENIEVIGDPSQLQNAFLNLGINARDAILNKSGSIKITTDNIQLDSHFCINSHSNISPGRYILIEISDTGCGIPLENIQKIFEPFYTTKEDGQGTGLGLAAVYGTVADHQGCVDVSSEINIGTTFKIYLPTDDSNTINSSSHSEKIISGFGRILVVDDEEIIRSTTSIILSNLGYDVIAAESSEAALKILSTTDKKFDLIILDLIMPKESGEECFYKIKTKFPNIPIVIASGFARDTRVEHLFEKDLAGFIQKPFRSAELSKILNNILKKK